MRCNITTKLISIDTLMCLYGGSGEGEGIKGEVVGCGWADGHPNTCRSLKSKLGNMYECLEMVEQMVVGGDA